MFHAFEHAWDRIAGSTPAAFIFIRFTRGKHTRNPRTERADLAQKLRFVEGPLDAAERAIRAGRGPTRRREGSMFVT
jgi:hypothetical protein